MANYKKIEMSRRNLVLSLGFGLGLPSFLAACSGKKTAEKGVFRVALNGGSDSLDPLLSLIHI